MFKIIENIYDIKKVIKVFRDVFEKNSLHDFHCFSE
jgi:hypothetical protein